MMTACHLVRSTIDHTRHGTPSHFLSRKGLSVLVDLDRLDEADSQSAFFSIDRFSLLSVKQSDYGPNFKREGPVIRLADYARQMAGEICPGQPIASVLLLTFPRILGVAFNPVSIYVLRGHDGRDLVYIYEVRNTFGDMHSYIGRAETGKASGDTVLHAAKIFYVSPFFPVTGDYQLRVRVSDKPDMPVRVLMRYSIDGAVKLTATLRGVAETLTTEGVFRALLASGQFPLRPLVSIHVEAARLWLKKVPYFRRPVPPQPWSRAKDTTSR